MIMPIIRHELRQVIYKDKTWYSLALLQILLALIFNWLMNNFLNNQVQTANFHYGITEEVLHPFYAWFSLLFLLFLPTLTTQMICAEKQHETIINYYCTSISPLQFVLGKFLTLNILMLGILSFASIMPFSIIISGSIDWGQYLSTVTGVYLILTAAMSIGFCISAFMSNVIRANLMIFFILGIAILFEWAAQFMGTHAIFLQSFGLLKPLKDFLAGIISLHSIVYYILLTFTGIWLGSLGYARGRNA